MIGAVQADERAWHRQRSRSAASGPIFALPGLPDMGGVAPPVTGSLACPAPSVAPASPHPEVAGVLGRSVGNGQCVALARAMQPEIGPTAGWSEGAAVQGNTALTPGTVIATFTNGRYANATDGSSHAAVYLGQNADGMQVLDQWVGKEAGVRTIPWTNPGAAAANTGTAYRVVRTG